MTATGISRIGNSSYTFEQALFQNNQCVALCEAAMALTSNGKAVSLPGDARDRIHAMSMAETTTNMP